jgi:hypothetical protein
MMEAVRTSETSVDNHFTRQYNPEDSSEHHTRRRENLKSHMCTVVIKSQRQKLSDPHYSRSQNFPAYRPYAHIFVRFHIAPPSHRNELLTFRPVWSIFSSLGRRIVSPLDPTAKKVLFALCLKLIANFRYLQNMYSEMTNYHICSNTNITEM